MRRAARSIFATGRLLRSLTVWIKDFTCGFEIWENKRGLIGVGQHLVHVHLLMACYGKSLRDYFSWRGCRVCKGSYEHRTVSTMLAVQFCSPQPPPPKSWAPGTGWARCCCQPASFYGPWWSGWSSTTHMLCACSAAEQHAALVPSASITISDKRCAEARPAALV